LESDHNLLAVGFRFFEKIGKNQQKKGKNRQKIICQKKGFGCKIRIFCQFSEKLEKTAKNRLAAGFGFSANFQLGNHYFFGESNRDLNWKKSAKFVWQKI